MEGFSRLTTGQVKLHRPVSGSPAEDHFVEFYEDTPALVASVRRFLSAGLSSGHAAIVIATPPHRTALKSALARIFNIEASQLGGQLVMLDAEETLSKFMVSDLPDPARFDETVGDVVRKVGAGGRQVLAFGEMVAVLWAQGNVGGALALEDLWNTLGQKHSFRLFCAYPIAAFGQINSAPLMAVCERHSHVLTPAPSH